MNSGSIELKDEERTPCEVWCRAMGYFRPVSYFNTGKQGEYNQRVNFSEAKAMTHADHLTVK